MVPWITVFIKYSDDELFQSQAEAWLKRQTYPNIEIISDHLDLSRARGKYILITDDTNLYQDDAFEKLIRIAEENQADMVCFGMEVHWESNTDARMLSPTNYVYPFFPYRMDGMPAINAAFINGVNPYTEATIIRRDFLVKNKLTQVVRRDAFVRQCAMHKPRAYTLRSFFGNHIIRTYTGFRTPNDFLAVISDSYDFLRKYAKENRKTRHWIPAINDMINRFALDSALGQMSKVVPLDHIPQCSIHLVDHCNLNCKSCSHFSCLARAGDFELKLDDFKRDMLQLRKITHGKVRILELYGGEPLLHPNVIPFMKYARLMFPKSLIRFITNGILLPQQKPEFWKAVHRYNILISPTKYPINVDWEQVEAKARKYGAALDFFGGTGFCQKTLYHKPLDLMGRQNVSESFINCQHTRCINLYRGRLYHCPIVAYIHYFNRQFKTNLRPCAADSLDIYEKDLTPQEVFNYCARPIPFCRYCFARGTTHGHPWQVTKKDISEWTMIRRKN